MSAVSDGSGGGGENEDEVADELAREQDLRLSSSDDEETGLSGTGIVTSKTVEQAFGNGDSNLSQKDQKDKLAAEPGSPVSPSGTLSIPDDTPSIQGSLLSSPGSSVPASRATPSRTASGSLLPFDRRFQSRLSSSPSPSVRNISPAFLSPGSRQSSLSWSLPGIEGERDAETETPQAPWEVVRWSKLRKISGQIFSEVGKRNFGRPTSLVVAASLITGTSKGYILAFDYQQTLKVIIGPGTQGISFHFQNSPSHLLIVYSRRKWQCYSCCYISRLLHCCQWACQREYLYMGAGPSRQTLSTNSAN